MIIIHRNYWEFTPDQFTFENANFESTLDSVIKSVKQDLKCEGTAAILQKLVISAEGSHFGSNHKDLSNKEDFGTLIIQLPSLFTGSSLTVDYDNETETVEFDCEESKYRMVYSAFYANCTYEVTPIESGYQFTLIYKLRNNDSLNSLLDQLEESAKLKQDVVDVLTKVPISFVIILREFNLYYEKVVMYENLNVSISYSYS